MPVQHEHADLLQLDLLVGRGVYDRDGRKIAAVSEVQLARRRDVYVVEALHIGVQGWIERVAFAPALRTLAGMLGFVSWRPEVRMVRWDQIDRIDPHKIHLRCMKDELGVLEPLE